MRLDISIGPVQGFVSQSRRTRDLWGSSYLLAFLSAQAMRGANDAGAKIIHPLVDDDPLFNWVSGARAGAPPRIGSVPNHFAVETDDPQAVADSAKQRFHLAWKRVCDAVWSEYMQSAASLGHGTKEIWDRQMGAFWEVSWTAGPNEERAALLARRKHWRDHRPPDEPGDKCAVMHDFQELSGFVRARDRERQDEFWKRVRRRTGALDLRDSERLCAVALVKRLFPRVAENALGWDVGTTNWPSTAYVAAVPWMRRVIEYAPEAASRYAEAVGQNAENSVFSMQNPPFDGLNAPEAGRFPKLDANYMNREFIQDARLCPLKDGADRGELGDELRKIYDAAPDGQTLGPPPAFYAMLLADGDRLGKLVSAVGGDRVSQALASFTERVPDVVANLDGVTIYAGGDDVLAMLPVERAIECADALAREYGAAFDDASEATLSAAVVFAHARLPLSSTLRQAHRLLDGVAKDGNGRDSLAAAVLKPGGLNCQWVSAWNRDGLDERATGSLARLGEALKPRGEEPGLSSSLIYRVRESLSLLCGYDQWEPGVWAQAPDGLDLAPFLRAEILDSLATRMDAERANPRAEELTERFLSLLHPARNSRTEDSDAQTKEVGLDALLLARFLNDPAESEADR